MRKKLTVNTLAVKSVKTRKKQYAVMIIGIILSVIFSSGIIFLLSAIQTSVKEADKANFGTQREIIYNVPEKALEIFDENEKEYLTYQTLSYAYTENNSDGGASVVYMNGETLKAYNLTLLDGRFPENKGEIAIEKSALSKLGYKGKKVGDKITLTEEICDGENYLKSKEKKTYILTGIIKDRRANILISYTQLNDNFRKVPAAYVSTADELSLGGKERTDCLYFSESAECAYNIMYPSGKDENVSVTEYITSGSLTGSAENENIYYSGAMAASLAAVLMLASCLAIVNAFSANLDDRKKQIGMLRAVGATKRQIINIFGREAFYITLISTPAGILISYILVYAVIKLMGDEFKFKPNIPVLLVCALFSIISVMLAAMLPLSKAARISPVQAIRNVEYAYKMKRKHIKSQKSFNVSQLLAKRSGYFSRTRQIAVSVFLIITIVASGYGCGFVKNMINNSYVYAYDYNIQNYGTDAQNNTINTSSGTYTESDRRELEDADYISDVSGAKTAQAFIKKDGIDDYDEVLRLYGGCYQDDIWSSLENAGDKDYNELKKSFKEEEFLSKIRQKFGISESLINAQLNGLDSETLEKLTPYVSKGKIDTEKILSGEEIILYAPDEISFVYSADGSYGIITNKNDIEENDNIIKTAKRKYKVGDKINLTVFNAKKPSDDGDELPQSTEERDITVKIGAIISNIDILKNDEFYISRNFSYNNNAKIYTSNSFFSSICECGYARFDVNTDSEITDTVNASIKSSLETVADRQNGGEVYSQYEADESNLQMAKALITAVTALIIILVSVSASIINNSLSAKIKSSKREIGTLRAVGASANVISKAYITELLKMLLTGTAAGFVIYIVSYVIAYFYTKSIGENINNLLPFTIWQAAAACAVLFIICSVNLYVKIKREMKNSIIDNIRNE